MTIFSSTTLDELLDKCPPELGEALRRKIEELEGEVERLQAELDEYEE